MTMRICIVDDDAANVEYFSRVLQEYETVSFTDSHSALDYCREKEIDLVLADQKMPGLSGIELIKEIMKIHSDFIGIIVSAYTDIPDLIEAVNSNIIYKYIVKPFSHEALLLQIKRGLETLESVGKKIHCRKLFRILRTALRERTVRI